MQLSKVKSLIRIYKVLLNFKDLINTIIVMFHTLQRIVKIINSALQVR